MISRRIFFGLTSLLGITLIDGERRGGIRAQRNDPNSEAIACLLKNDTQCAVDVWEDTYEDHEYDDDIRESYVNSLVMHSIRNLDIGNLRVARRSLNKAKTIMSRHVMYEYLEDIVDTYDTTSWNRAIATRPFTPTDTQDFESRYISVDNFFGAEATVFAMTTKVPDFYNYYMLGLNGVGRTAGIRTVVQPMSANGSIVLLFGIQSNSDYFMIRIGWTGSESVEWSLMRAGRDGVEPYGAGGYLILDIDRWHWFEVRMRGSQMELWVDMVIVGSEVVLDYDRGDFGVGVGLNTFESGRSFSALFEHIAVFE